MSGIVLLLPILVLAIFVAAWAVSKFNEEPPRMSPSGHFLSGETMKEGKRFVKEGLFDDLDDFVNAYDEVANMDAWPKGKQKIPSRPFPKKDRR